MKRIYYILCIAALLGGCQKELLNNPAATHGELTFNTSLDGVPIAQSRAAGVNTDLTANGFYLAGYHTEGQIDAAHATAYPNVFDKEVADQQIAVPLVKYENSKFTLKTIKWLLDDVSYLSFFGWSQSKPFAATVDASTTGILNQTFDSNDKGYPWIDIRNADAPLDQTDVVGSRSLNHKNDAVLSAVDLDFRHLLSKLTFKAKSSSGANITFTGVNIKYAASKVRKKGRYTFGSDASAIGSYSLNATEFQAGTAPLGSSYPTITAGAEVSLGSALLLPQALAAGDVSIELKYKLSPNSGNIEGAEQTKTLPLSAFTFEQGNNYTYTINVLSTSILIEPGPTIEPWNVVAMPLPLIPGPRGDVLLLLDGYDKPYIHTDGKHYWLDRSGYNRHMELVGYYPTQYDGINHCYTFANTAENYGLIPAFPNVTALSVNVVTNRTPGTTRTQQTLLDFHQTTNLSQDNDRRFWTHMGNLNNNILYFDCSSENYNTAGKGRLIYDIGSSNFEKRYLWTFTKQDAGAQQIYQNANLRAKSATSGSKSLGVLATNVLGRLYGGSVAYLRVSSKIQTAQQVDDIYNENKIKHKIEDVMSADYNYTKEPANCYIGYPGKTFMFAAYLKPRTKNGSITSATTCTDVLLSEGLSNDLLATDIENVQVAWQTAANHGTTGGADNMIIQKIEYNNVTGFCKVTPHSSGTGNAVLVAKNSSGTILWNWHIWVTDGTVKNMQTVHGVTYLDRNVGALATTNSQPTAEEAYKYFGITYYWGSKTALTGQGSGTNRNTHTKIFNAAGIEISGNSGGFTTNSNKASNMKTCIQNPLTIYSGVSNSPRTWSDGPAEKSLYDPCPYGYRMPESSTFTQWTVPTTWSGTYLHAGIVYGSNWWPATGYRLSSVGYDSYYWTSTYNSSTTAYCVWMAESNRYQGNASRNIPTAFSIRCRTE